MFTGIIEATGSIDRIEPRQGDVCLRIATGQLELGDCVVGDSIAVNGVCLTAVEIGPAGFVADVSRETLSRTTLGVLKSGDPVNLEKALRPTSRLGGHLVSGHVDGVGELLQRRDDARSVRLMVRCPDALSRYIAAKGSICLDGVSLTVNDVRGSEFDLNIVPHTLSATTLGGWTTGQQINIEVDIVARYLERLIRADTRAGAESGRITADLLAEYGFLGK